MSKTFFKEEVEKFQYFQVPQWLFKPPYNQLSSQAKLMYALLFDRLGLSLQNEWHDREGKIFMYFTNAEFCEALNCSERTVIKIKKELIEADLLVEERQGLTKPNRLYLHSPRTEDLADPELKNLQSRTEKNAVQEVQKVQTIKTDNIKTNLTNNKLSLCREVIAYLNEKTGKNFHATSKGHQKFIIARMNEGYTLDQFKQVIDVMVAKWKGTKWEEYLRPKTLFGSSFDDYLNKPMPRGRQVVDEKPDERLNF